MMNQIRLFDYSKYFNFKMLLSIGALVFLFGCASVQLPPEIEAELNPAQLVTPAAPALPTATAVYIPEVPAPAAAESSEVSSYPEPAAEGADSAYPAAEAEIDVDAVLEETSLVAEAITKIDPDTLVPAAEQSEATYLELGWPDLVPADFSADAIYAKYQEELSQYQDGDPQAQEVFQKMQEEFNNAPTNDELNGKLVRVPGFITPLDYSSDTVTEFLLVPYFGACIHVPPPPVNQTVFVSTGAEDGIALEDTFAPIWVMGVLATESTTTELAMAGYTITDAKIELYSYEQ